MIYLKTRLGKIPILDKFSYTRQVGDIGNVATSNSNFTNSFKVLKNEDSTRILMGLGLHGSNSQIPYSKVPVVLEFDGVEVVRDGWLQISETTKDYYRISVLDGNIDFWKAIEGVTLQDIDLSEANHNKNLTTVIDSFQNEYYKYILADYGGQTDVVARRYNIAHLPASINEFFIFRRIFRHINMSYNMPIEIDTWLTYPKESSGDAEIDPDPSVSKINNGNYQLSSGWVFDSYAYNIPLSKYGEVALGSSQNPSYYNNYITNFEDGNYDVEIDFRHCDAEYELEQMNYGEISYHRLGVKIFFDVNGVRTRIDDGTKLIAFRLNRNDRVRIVIEPYNSGEEFAWATYDVVNVTDLTIDDFNIRFQKYQFEEVNFSDALKSIKASDFIKYIMHRYGLTLFYANKNVDFKTVDQRLNSEVISYDQFFKEQINEKYTYSDYAQRNILAHKYVDDDRGFNDGIIICNNKNLREETTLLESFTFSPTRTNQLLNFEIEVKERNNEIELNYKWVDRNFSIKENQIYTLSTVFYSDIEQNEITFTGTVPMLNLRGTTFKEYKTIFYEGIERILNSSKIHNIVIDISIYQFIQIDLSKKVWIRNSEYLINSASFVENGTVNLELIKVN